jgi:hypothetical protein
MVAQIGFPRAAPLNKRSLAHRSVPAKKEERIIEQGNDSFSKFFVAITRSREDPSRLKRAYLGEPDNKTTAGPCIWLTTHCETCQLFSMRPSISFELTGTSNGEIHFSARSVTLLEQFDADIGDRMQIDIQSERVINVERDLTA